jgi:membrane-associated PAP2 superfamily phosphatase
VTVATRRVSYTHIRTDRVRKGYVLNLVYIHLLVTFPPIYSFDQSSQTHTLCVIIGREKESSLVEGRPATSTTGEPLPHLRSSSPSSLSSVFYTFRPTQATQLSLLLSIVVVVMVGRGLEGFVTKLQGEHRIQREWPPTPTVAELGLRPDL